MHYNILLITVNCYSCPHELLQKANLLAYAEMAEYIVEDFFIDVLGFHC